MLNMLNAFRTLYRSIGFDDPGMEDTNNNDATEDNSIPTTNDVLQDVN